MRNSVLSTKLRNYFIAGVLVIAPTAVSFYFLYRAFIWVDNLLGGFIQGLEFGGHQLPGLGFLTVVCIILAVGFLTSGYLGSRILGIWEQVLSTIPLLNRIYPALKQIGSAMLADQSRAFRAPVLIEYPRRGVYSLAFSTKRPPPLVERHVDTELISVFLPTTPNPTSGFLLMVPRAEAVELDMTVEEALKLVISGGMVSPESEAGGDNGRRERARQSDRRVLPGTPVVPAAAPGAASGSAAAAGAAAADGVSPAQPTEAADASRRKARQRSGGSRRRREGAARPRRSRSSEPSGGRRRDVRDERRDSKPDSKPDSQSDPPKRRRRW